MAIISRPGQEHRRTIIFALESLAHRLMHRAGEGPEGSAHWFTFTPHDLRERGELLRRQVGQLDRASQMNDLERALLAARRVLEELLKTARGYHVPIRHHRRVLWFLHDDAAPATPIDVNPNEVRFALGDVENALRVVAPHLVPTRRAA